MIASEQPGGRRVPGHRAWVPRQHGAWAMLLLPVLLGVAASRPDAWQVVLGAAALAGYLASAALQAWSRARRPPEYRAPILVYGGLFVVLGLVLVASFPGLLLVLLVAGPSAVIVFMGAKPGTRRDLVNSTAQVAQALVLVPATAHVSGAFEPEPVAAYTLVAAAYLFGSVLVVRSVLRERGNRRFAVLSAGFHLAVVGAAVVALPAPYALVAAALGARAVALPFLQRRLAPGPRPLRPIHVGIVEIVSSLAVVLVSFAAPI